jgi:hypothetical protein
VRGTGLFSSRTLATVAVSLFALIGCCLLAWWQWTRFESASGTLQNLGYVLQWPLFGVFPGFMFWRIHRAAQRERAEAEAEAAADIAEPVTESASGAEPTSGTAPAPAEASAQNGRRSATKPAPADDWPDQLTYVQNRAVDDADPELRAYNSYLATLSAREQDT